MKEQWRDIPGYEGVYQVSDWGSVRSVDRVIVFKKSARSEPYRRFFSSRSIPQFLDAYGYSAVSLSRQGKTRSFTVHRLVAIAFIGNRPSGSHIHHIDKDKRNNNLSNLAYISGKEHVSLHMKGMYRGEDNPQSILSDAQVSCIKKLLSHDTFSRDEIAEAFGVSGGAITNINLKKSWLHIGE